MIKTMAVIMAMHVKHTSINLSTFVLIYFLSCLKVNRLKSFEMVTKVT